MHDRWINVLKLMGGGKGKNAVSWNIGKSEADYIACVNLSEDEV